MDEKTQWPLGIDKFLTCEQCMKPIKKGFMLHTTFASIGSEFVPICVDCVHYMVGRIGTGETVIGIRAISP